MIEDEFLSIAGQALRSHKGADSVTVRAIEPTPLGPMVRWEGPLLARQRARTALEGGGTFVGPPAGPLLLDLLARTLACRWRDGLPRCPRDWQQRLVDRHRPLLGDGDPGTGPGWRWLWDAACESITEVGVPKGWHTSQIKEKFGTVRWYYDVDENCDYADNVVDAVEHLSAYICEECGKPGRLRQGGWIRCLCIEHAKGRRVVGD